MSQRCGRCGESDDRSGWSVLLWLDHLRWLLGDLGRLRTEPRALELFIEKYVLCFLFVLYSILLYLFYLSFILILPLEFCMCVLHLQHLLGELQCLRTEPRALDIYRHYHTTTTTLPLLRFHYYFTTTL